MKSMFVPLQFRFFSRFQHLFTAAALFATITLSASLSWAGPMSFQLTPLATGQGSVLPSDSLSLTAGERASFVFDAQEGHHVADVIVDGVSVGPLAALSFENISASHTLEVVFESDAIGAVAVSH